MEFEAVEESERLLDFVASVSPELNYYQFFYR